MSFLDECYINPFQLEVLTEPGCFRTDSVTVPLKDSQLATVPGEYPKYFSNFHISENIDYINLNHCLHP